MPPDNSAAFPKCRRAIAGLSLFSSAVLSGIALFQVGIVEHLPDPPFGSFDADAVHSSPEAYAIFGIPDALLGMASYTATACLACMESSDRRMRSRWMPIALASKASLDAAIAGALTARQATKFRKFSLWSLLVGAATAAALPLAIRGAVQTFTGGRACSNQA